MSLDLDIQALLRSPEVQEINFDMRGLLVTGRGFTELATCFSDTPISHRIRVTVRSGLVSATSAASFNSTTDTIHLRSPDVMHTIEGRRTIVHECTHAQTNLRGRGTSIRSEEAAAFIAQSWYLLACGVSDSEINRLTQSDILTIATDLRTQAQAGGGIISVSAEQINLARRIIATAYPMDYYPNSDGIGGRIYRGS
jgi:hypothetical protein